MFQRVNYGPVTNEKNSRLVDLRPREWLVIVPIIAMTVVMGVLPNLFLKPMAPSVQRMLNQVQQGATPQRLEARATSRPPRAASHERRATSNQPRATSNELRATSNELRATSNELRATSYEPRATSYEPRAHTDHWTPTTENRIFSVRDGFFLQPS
jgi:hypothetical protein